MKHFSLKSSSVKVTVLFIAATLLCAFASQKVPTIHSGMSEAELEVVASYIKAASDKSAALERILIKEFRSGSRANALASYAKCISKGHPACESNAFVNYSGATEALCYLLEQENALAREALNNYPFPAKCSPSAMTRIESVAAYLNHLEKLTGGSISTSCGSVHKHKWTTITHLLQNASYFPSDDLRHNKKATYQGCKTSSPDYHCEGSPESTFGVQHWATQGIWQKEQYEELQHLKEKAIQDLAEYYSDNNMISNPSETASYYLDELENAYIGHTGPTAVNSYETAYWTLDDLDQYLAYGRIDRKETAYYSKFADSTQEAILSRLLFLAVANNYSLSAIDQLLANGAPTRLAPPFMQKPGHLPLFETTVMQAVKRPEVVEALLKHGADPNAQNRFGKTPLMYALQVNEPKSVHILLIADADPNLPTLAIDRLDKCNFALESGNRTPLMYAAWYVSSSDTIRDLLAAGANLSIKDSSGHTACDYLERNESANETEKIKMARQICKHQ